MALAKVPYGVRHEKTAGPGLHILVSFDKSAFCWQRTYGKFYLLASCDGGVCLQRQKRKRSIHDGFIKIHTEFYFA
jgi:hypothetical protein